jgi:hypothetical protein
MVMPLVTDFLEKRYLITTGLGISHCPVSERSVLWDGLDSGKENGMRSFCVFLCLKITTVILMIDRVYPLALCKGAISREGKVQQ